MIERRQMVQKGFTLIEMLIALVVLGLMILTVQPMLNMAFTFIEKSMQMEEILNNKKLGDALVEYARNRDGVSRNRLPAPVYAADDSVNGGLYDPTKTDSESLALARTLLAAGVQTNAINFDSTAAKNARVYQVVSGQTIEVPYYGSTGDKVTLTYDYGVLYATKCMRASACYKNATAANPPGDSAQITAATIASWGIAGQDQPPIAFSTLDNQKQLLRATAGRVNQLSERFVTDFHNKIRLAAADSTLNFFETNTGGLALGNVDPALNFGCRDGWYALSAANVDVLTKLGLNKSEMGVTAWGAPISYCRDFDPAGTGTWNDPPHYGALMINKNMISTAVPTVLADALIIPF